MTDDGSQDCITITCPGKEFFLCSVLQEDLEGEKAFTDLVIETSDGTAALECHQVVLASASPLIRSLLVKSTNNQTNSNGSTKQRKTHKIIKAHQLPAHDVETLITALYTGEAIISHDRLDSILRTRQELELYALNIPSPSSGNRSSKGSKKNGIHITTSDLKDSGPETISLKSINSNLNGSTQKKFQPNSDTSIPANVKPDSDGNQSPVSSPQSTSSGSSTGFKGKSSLVTKKNGLKLTIKTSPSKPQLELLPASVWHKPISDLVESLWRDESSEPFRYRTGLDGYIGAKRASSARHIMDLNTVKSSLSAKTYRSPQDVKIDLQAILDRGKDSSARSPQLAQIVAQFERKVSNKWNSLEADLKMNGSFAQPNAASTTVGNGNSILAGGGKRKRNSL